MKTALLLMFLLIVLSYSTLYTVVAREDFNGSTFPPAGWAQIAKSVGGGVAYGGWTLLSGAAHGEIRSSYMTAYSMIFTSAFHANAGDSVIVIFRGKPSANPNYCPLIVMQNNGDLIWSDYIKPADSQWKNFQYKTSEITIASDKYRVGWEVDYYYPSCWSMLDLDDVKVIVATPDKADTQVEASSLGRIKSVYR